MCAQCIIEQQKWVSPQCHVSLTKTYCFLFCCCCCFLIHHVISYSSAVSQTTPVENWCHRSLKPTTTNHREQRWPRTRSQLESLQFVSVCLPSSPQALQLVRRGLFIGSTRRAFSPTGQEKAVFIHPFKHTHTHTHTHTHSCCLTPASSSLSVSHTDSSVSF